MGVAAGIGRRRRSLDMKAVYVIKVFLALHLKGKRNK